MIQGQRAGTPRRVLIAMPVGRVGSNLMMAYLAGFKPARTASEALLRCDTASEQLEWLDDFYTPSDAERFALICTKEALRIMIDAEAIETFVRNKDIAVIRMFRRDVVRAAISHIRGQQLAQKTAAETGRAVWGVMRGEAKLGPTTIDVRKLDRLIGIHSATGEQLSGLFLGCRHIDIVYEDLSADIQGTTDRVADFLGLERRSFVSPFDKATPESLWDVIENRDEIADFLAGKGLVA